MHTPLQDFLGLRVLWPKPGHELAKIEHDGPVSDWQTEAGHCWPVDFLPQDLKNTRILSFGYNTDKSIIRPDEKSQKGRIFNHGEALCGDLMDNRALLKKFNPTITFIGHGAGGIVIKSALCYSHARSKYFGLVLRRTRHVIFLDTPHAGLNEVAWKSISQGILSKEGDSQWKLWSDVLSDLRKIFSDVASGFNISSACASLVSSQTSLGDEVVPGDSGLTNLGHERVLHFDKVEHLTISKFSSRDNSNYVRLVHRIQAGWIHITKDDGQISAIWSWLGVQAAGGGQRSLPDSSTWNTMDHETALHRHHPKTGEWLLRDTTFRKWKSRSRTGHGQSRLLWVTGQGGAGKSVLCSYAIHTISNPQRPQDQNRDTPAPATPYIYVRYGIERSKRQLAQLLASQLLDHVIREQGGVEVEVLSLLKQNASAVPNLHRLIRLLVGQCSTVYFFLDGLNEIDLTEAEPSEARREELDRLTKDLKSTVEFLVDLARDDDLHVRIWCSSQKAENVVTWMQDLGAMELEMDIDRVREDVQLFLADVSEQILERITKPEDKLFVKAGLIIQGSNFRWAYMMAESLRNCRQPRRLMQKVKDGLPRDLQTSYSSRLQELRNLDSEDSKDGNPPLSMSILSILTFARRPLRLSELQEALSILDARRVNGTEAACENLEPAIVIQRKDIMHRCTPLVDFFPFPDTDTEGFLLLSHGSVLKFLRKTQESLGSKNSQKRTPTRSLFSSKRDEGQNDVVDKRLIAKACIKYLSQAQFSKPLKKLSPQHFRTATSPSTDIRDHRFLQYAAKYWYRHIEDMGFSTRCCADVTSFVTSPQFITVIQMQSLFVVGHFIHSFDENEDCGPGAANYGRLMKRNLPEWFRERDEGKQLVTEYEKFFLEWSTFLQLGVTDRLNGEVERCLWGMLGENNFLWKFGSKAELNKSYALGTTPDPRRPREGACLFETICNGGRRVSVWSLVASADTQESRNSPNPPLSLTRDMWYVDGQRPPFQYGPQETITFDPNSVGWDFYDPCRSRTFPLVPKRASSVARATPVADCRHGLNIRIGGVEFFRERRDGLWVPRGPFQKMVDVNQPPSRLYWEDVLVHGPYKVKSRRVQIGCGSSSRRRQPKFKSKRARTLQRHQRFPGNDLAASDVSDSSSRVSPDYSSQEIISSANEYWTSDSTESELPESDAENEEAHRSQPEDAHDDQDEDNEYVELENDLSSSIEQDWSLSESRTDDSGFDRESLSFRSTFRTGTAPPVLDAGDDAGSEGFSEQSDDNDEKFYQPGIGRRTVALFCNLCEKEILHNKRPNRNTRFYQCTLCPSKDSFDICRTCFRDGKWCQSNTHQLRRMTLRKGRLVTLEILSRDNIRPGVRICVTRIGEGASNEDEVTTARISPEKKIFRFTMKSRDSHFSLLHASRPVVHPAVPLLVYPLQGTKLLFANLDNNTYMTHGIPYDKTERSYQRRNNILFPIATISMDMRFSPCGQYLHVARVTAAAAVSTRSKSRLMKKVFLQTITVQLSTRDPCSGIPRTLAARPGIGLGRWRAPAVLMLPYHFTWTDPHLYVSMVSTSLMLNVLRIPLSTPDEPIVPNRKQEERPAATWEPSKKEEHEQVMTLAESIPLPRSARIRSVHFYPAGDGPGSCDRVIIGSTHGSGAGAEQAQPPAVVYLRPGPERDSVEWVPADEAVMSSSKDTNNGRLRRRANDPLLEDFDVDSDCDLIMPLHDFQK